MIIDNQIVLNIVHKVIKFMLSKNFRELSGKVINIWFELEITHALHHF